MKSPTYTDILSQSAFDYIVEEVLLEARKDNEFSIGYHFSKGWIDSNISEFYADEWNRLNDDQKYQVVLDVKEQVARWFDNF